MVPYLMNLSKAVVPFVMNPSDSAVGRMIGHHHWTNSEVLVDPPDLIHIVAAEHLSDRPS